MANNNLDLVHLAKRVADQLVRFPRGKSLEWKINFLRWKFEKQNFGDCCKMIIDGAEVALKVEEKLSKMEAKLKRGEGDEKLRLKVELVRRKVERYHLMMLLFSVSKNPVFGKFLTIPKSRVIEQSFLPAKCSCLSFDLQRREVEDVYFFLKVADGNLDIQFYRI